MPRKKKKKSKIIRPPTGYKSRAPGMNPESAMRYHKGYVYDRVRYTVLTLSQMDEEMKRHVVSVMKPITTGTQVKTLPNGTNGWSVEVLDRLGQGRTLLVAYRGIEVCLFFQRQLTTVDLQPGDHFPEGVVQDPQEAWQRLDLLGLSAKKANLVLASEHSRMEEQIKILKGRIDTLESLNYELDKKYRKISERKEVKARREVKKKKRRK
jgi:hypothetical protein